MSTAQSAIPGHGKPLKSRTVRGKRTIGHALAVLDVNEDNLTQTAKALKLPKSTLKDWRDNYSTDPTVAHYRTLKNEELADRFRVMSAMAAERLIKDMHLVPVGTLATVAGIGADKQLLLTGQATSITANPAQPVKTLAELIYERTGERISEDQAARIMAASVQRLQAGKAVIDVTPEPVHNIENKEVTSLPRSGLDDPS